ncbi:helix-hairpin-helix domain-containing protein [Legionella israelensis]|uniref:Helix-hairpin-helix domain-containing protein n=1 Tax=Legionella israelensis TaxID=454 RepID=A0AAX1EHD0_9GAMM|nr:helix-hairpin-helix domain-containing protein [Legionella israelensis]QBR84442.1 helix-hairpin-helix domain-containing protein [Legionella israelensis]
MKAKIIAVLLSISFSLICSFSLSSHAASSSLKSPSAGKTAEKINLNKADLQSLIHSYKGIGKKRAEAILAYREKHDGFKSIEELAKVKGFSKKFVQTHLKQLNDVFCLQ